MGVREGQDFSVSREICLKLRGCALHTQREALLLDAVRRRPDLLQHLRCLSPWAGQVAQDNCKRAVKGGNKQGRAGGRGKDKEAKKQTSGKKS